MCLNNRLAYGKTDPDSFVAVRGFGDSLLTLENIRKLFFTDTPAVIPDCK